VSVKPSFFAELQRRHVYKVGAMYCVAGWLLVQIVTQVLPVFDVSALGQRILVLIVVAGFPIALVLAWLFDLTPQGIVRTPDAAGESPAERKQRHGMDRQLNYLLGALLLLAMGYLVLERTVLRNRQIADTTAGDKSIAVLPFDSLSDDKSNAWFAEGIQDEILTRLAKVGALKVISRTSTAQYASHPGNLTEIAAKLGVANILEGSVEKVGAKVRINVQLIRAADDNHLWAEIYDRSADDILGVQGEVAAAIAGAMNAKLSGAEQRQLAQRPTQVPAAYEAYLHGLAIEQRFAFAAPDVEARITAYTRAVELDPDFAAAWARLAGARVDRYFLVTHTPAVLAEAAHPLEQAQRLAPDAVETLAAQGLYQYWGKGDYDAAAGFYGRALQASPSYSEAIAMLGHVRRRQNRWLEALQLDQRAVELDPLNVNYLINLNATLRGLRRYDEAVQVLDRALSATPGDPATLAQRAFTEQMLGKLDAAGRDAELLPLQSDNYLVLGARFVQWHLQRDTARGIAEMRQVLQRRDRLDPATIAAFLQLLGTEEILAGQHETGRGHLAESRDLLHGLIAGGDDNPNNYEALALDESLLDEPQAALRDAATSVAMVAHDAFQLPDFEAAQAQVMMRAGDKAGAIALLARALQQPAFTDPTPPLLRLDPLYDPLRQEPAFQKLLADPPPLRLDGPAP
jgi:TolB-like protein